MLTLYEYDNFISFQLMRKQFIVSIYTVKRSPEQIFDFPYRITGAFSKQWDHGWEQHPVCRLRWVRCPDLETPHPQLLQVWVRTFLKSVYFSARFIVSLLFKCLFTMVWCFMIMNSEGDHAIFACFHVLHWVFIKVSVVFIFFYVLKYY